MSPLDIPAPCMTRRTYRSRAASIARRNSTAPHSVARATPAASAKAGLSSGAVPAPRMRS